MAIKDMPKARAMKTRLDVLGNAKPEAGTVGAGVLAIWVPAKATKRNKKVPTNSPMPATTVLRAVEG